MGSHMPFAPGHNADDEQLTVAAVVTPGVQYISGFLVFDTASMPEVVVSARLRLLMTDWRSQNDDFEAIQAWDVSTPMNTLTASGSTQEIVDDLRSGVSYGMSLVDASLRGQVFYMELNQAAVDLINNATGTIAIGIGFATPSAGAPQGLVLASHHGRNGIEVTGFNP